MPCHIAAEPAPAGRETGSQCERLGGAIASANTSRPSNPQELTAPIRATLIGSDRCEAEGHTVGAYAPVLAMCRDLVAAGYGPATRLEAYRGDMLCLKVRSIGEGAKYTVKDSPTGMPGAASLPGAATRHSQSLSHRTERVEGTPMRPEVPDAPRTLSAHDIPAVHTATGSPNGSPGFYVPSAIKRSRRTKAEIGRIKASIIDILSQDHPQTVRQVFYALTVRGVIKKAEIEYQRTVVRLLVDMRESEQIPFEWLADNTRWMRKPSTFTGLQSCLNTTAECYRRNLWASMPVYVEVWCEKDALAGVLMEETEPYDVPLMTARWIFVADFCAWCCTDDQGDRQTRLHLSLRRP
jgi:hypothetical protein